MMDHETLRRWMLAERLWSRQRKRKKHCPRRERKSHFGELVQLDGSFHDWLEGRGPGGCLMDMVDDATSRTQARLGKEETIWAAAGVLQVWIEQDGVPARSTPIGRMCTSERPHPPSSCEERSRLRSSGACVRSWEFASLPPVRRKPRDGWSAHGVHQDWLVKKLRRKQIASYEAANQYLEQEYLPQHNRRFAQTAAEEEDYHGRRPSRSELQRIFRLETQRGSQRLGGAAPWTIFAIATEAWTLRSNPGQSTSL